MEWKSWETWNPRKKTDWSWWERTLIRICWIESITTALLEDSCSVVKIEGLVGVGTDTWSRLVKEEKVSSRRLLTYCRFRHTRRNNEGVSFSLFGLAKKMEQIKPYNDKEHSIWSGRRNIFSWLTIYCPTIWDWGPNHQKQIKRKTHRTRDNHLCSEDQSRGYRLY